MSMFARGGLAVVGIVSILGGMASSAALLTTAPLEVEGTNSFGCLIANVGTKDIEVSFAILNASGTPVFSSRAPSCWHRCTRPASAPLLPRCIPAFARSRWHRGARSRSALRRASSTRAGRASRTARRTERRAVDRYDVEQERRVIGQEVHEGSLWALDVLTGPVVEPACEEQSQSEGVADASSRRDRCLPLGWDGGLERRAGRGEHPAGSGEGHRGHGRPRSAIRR